MRRRFISFLLIVSLLATTFSADIAMAMGEGTAFETAETAVTVLEESTDAESAEVSGEETSVSENTEYTESTNVAAEAADTIVEISNSQPEKEEEEISVIEITSEVEETETIDIETEDVLGIEGTEFVIATADDAEAEEIITIKSEPAEDGAVAILTGKIPADAVATATVVYLTNEELTEVCI